MYYFPSRDQELYSRYLSALFKRLNDDVASLKKTLQSVRVYPKITVRNGERKTMRRTVVMLSEWLLTARPAVTRQRKDCTCFRSESFLHPTKGRLSPSRHSFSFSLLRCTPIHNEKSGATVSINGYLSVEQKIAELVSKVEVPAHVESKIYPLTR